MQSIGKKEIQTLVRLTSSTETHTHMHTHTHTQTQTHTHTHTHTANACTPESKRVKRGWREGRERVEGLEWKMAVSQRSGGSLTYLSLVLSPLSLSTSISEHREWWI